MIAFIKKHKAFVIIGVALLAGFFIIRALGADKEPVIRTLEIQKTDLAQEVSVTGKVKAMENIELALERSGRIEGVLAPVGATVKTGDALVFLNSVEAEADVARAGANLAAEEAAFTELSAGPTPEEIRVAETAFENAQQNLADAEADARIVHIKTINDVNEKYENIFAELKKSVSVGTQSMNFVTDVQYAHFNGGNTQTNLNFAEQKAIAVLAFFGYHQNAGRLTNESMLGLSGGTRSKVEALENGVLDAQVEGVSREMRSALDAIKGALDAIRIDDLSSEEKTNLHSEQLSVNNEVIALSGKEQAIVAQYTVNESALLNARVAVHGAQNTLRSAEDELALKKTPARVEKMTVAQARVSQARADWDSALARLSQYVLRAPFDGVVTRNDAIIGAIASPSTALVTLMSDGQFEIEVFIPEADIASVKIGDPARVTLDAYGEDVLFEARVFAIDPAATDAQGVPAYKTVLNFVTPDVRVRSGMTANVDIATAKREGVFAVPSRAIISRGGERYARLLRGEEVQEVAVQTGIKASDGMVEIISGLVAGDRVIIFTEE